MKRIHPISKENLHIVNTTPHMRLRHGAAWPAVVLFIMALVLAFLLGAMT